MTPEAKTKNAVKKILETSGAYFFMPFGGGFGRAGVPDIVACKNGKFIGIECKAPKGKTTALQERELAAIRAAGGSAMVITGQDNPLGGDPYEELKEALFAAENGRP